MSSKQVKNVDPRIAPKEMIVTRTKSALQKRKLRDKDRSMKAITQLIKSPPKSMPGNKSSPKKNKNVKVLKKTTPKSMDGECIEESKEFYPNKLKRKHVSKKILLKPKYQMKIVAATNKRKLGVIKKNIISPTKQESQPDNNESYRTCTQSPHSGVSEVVRWNEDTQSLDEEDWMEILTCPSPVWWEDPPDGYREEAIYTRTKPAGDTSDETQTDQQTEQIPLNIDLKTCNTKFIQKRSKLEHLLNNIKNRTPSTDDKTVDKDEQSEGCKTSDHSDSAEEDVFSDLSVNEEEILNNLENIDIPIETRSDKEITNNSANEHSILDIPNTMPKLTRCPMMKSKGNLKQESEEVYSSDFDTISDTNIKFLTEDEDTDKKSDNTIPSPTDRPIEFVQSVGEICNENSIHNDDKREDDCDGSIEEIINATATEDKGISQQNSDTEFITVYKIMSAAESTKSPETPKVNTIRVKSLNKLVGPGSNTNINLFFKKCKSNKRSSKSKMDFLLRYNKAMKNNANPSNDTKVVSKKDKIKYCYKCSSIFDTVECNYCSDTSEVVGKEFSCDMCDFVSRSRTKIIKHLIRHKAQESYEKL